MSICCQARENLREELSSQDYILSFSCPDQLGVVARSTSLLAESGAFVTEISNYSDPISQTFHMRVVFDNRNLNTNELDFESEFKKLTSEFQMSYQIRPKNQKPKILIAVSKYDHCLNVLLNKWKSGVLPASVCGIVSNHEDARKISDWYDLPFYWLPITPETKKDQEGRFQSIIDELDIDLLVLARYMQILSEDFCERLRGKAINIHHSFLPSFAGSRPYHQAYERGVKVIGATAHYVTPELDAGPIIVQEVRPITHETTVEQMVHLGHDIETTALCQAVRLHCEERVQINGNRTVIL